jgi:hypothetical protein
MRAQEFVAERKKSRRKKSSRYGGYFFPGYAYYGVGGDSGEGGGDGGGESRSGMAESNNKEQAVRRIQKMLNDRFNANLDVDGVLGPLTQKSINRFMPGARPGAADEPNRTTAVQGKTLKTNKVAEAFDQPYPIQWEQSDYGDYDALATLPDGTYLNIMFEHVTPYEVNISFWRNNSLEVTGEGDAQRIFATVLIAIQKFLTMEQPSNITFSASKEVEPGQNSESRAKLYNRMVNRYAAAWGYTPHSFDHGDEVKYELSRIKQDVAEGESNDTAISLSKLGKFHSGSDTLAEFVPERATAQYALHPDKWESTFYSLTNKDSDKLKYYGPKKISIPPGTLVGDMAIANKFYRAKTPEEQEQYAELYKASLKPYPVDVSEYRMPELLIPKHSVAEQQLDELSFLGSECTKDCSGHRAGYDWSKRKGLRQANSWSPSFNKGAGLAVAGK